MSSTARRAQQTHATPAPERQRLPRRRHGETTAVSINGAEVFVTTNLQPDGRPGEVFAKWGKDGSTSAGLMDMLSIAISLGLQHGVPMETFVEKFKDMRFEPFGPTDHDDIPEAASVGDFLARLWAQDHLTFEVRKRLGVLTPAEEEALPADAYAPTPLVRPAPRA